MLAAGVGGGVPQRRLGTRVGGAAGASSANRGLTLAVAVARQAHAEDRRNSRRFTTYLPSGFVLAGSASLAPVCQALIAAERQRLPIPPYAWLYRTKSCRRLRGLEPCGKARRNSGEAKGQRGFQLTVLSPSRRCPRSISVSSTFLIQATSSPRGSRMSRISPRLRAVVSSSHEARATASASPSLS